MKYGIHNLAYIALGEVIPIAVDGLKGKKIIYIKPILAGFDNGKICGGYSLQECIYWMNKKKK